MKKLVLGLSLILAASTANALSNNTKFVAVDNSVETGLCLVAGSKGYVSAVREAKQLGGKHSNISNISCNGVSVKEFAKSFKVTAPVETKTVTFVAGDNNVESKICTSAVTKGIQVTKREAKRSIHNISCNGVNIYDFVRNNKS